MATLTVTLTEPAAMACMAVTVGTVDTAVTVAWDFTTRNKIHRSYSSDFTS